MSNQSSVYSEKKLGYYEGSFKLGAFAKPQDVNLTLTAEHIYGLAYIMEQNGTREEDPVYTRFTCSLDEITRVYSSDNPRQTALYVQCDKVNKGALFRKKIVVPGVKNSDEAVTEILAAKEKYDEKHMKAKERESASASKAALNSGNPSVANAASEIAKAANAAVTAVKTENEVLHGTSENNVQASLNSMGKNAKAFGEDIMKGFGSVKKRAEGMNLFSKQGKASPKVPVQVEITKSENNANGFEGKVIDNDDFFNSIEVPKTKKTTERENEKKAVEETFEQKITPAEAVSDKTIESLPQKPKVTIEDLKRLNDSIDEDFLKNTEPPITGGKENADIYLDDIGEDYSSEPKETEKLDDDISGVENIVLQDMNDFTPAKKNIPEISELPDDVDTRSLISDMTGKAVDTTGEVTPIERMDFVPRSKANKHEAVDEISVIKPISAEIPEEAAKAIKDAEDILREDTNKEKIAAEDAYINDETSEDAKAADDKIKTEATDSEVDIKPEIEEVAAPEVKDVHIDFSTEVTNDTSLEDFEERVKKLKSMLDSGLITREEFMSEKKKLLETLY